MIPAARRRELEDAFARQARLCQRLGAPLAAALIGRCGEDVAAEGPVAELVASWEGDPVMSSLALRVLAAVHQDVLAGEAPELARHFPTAGGTPGGALSGTPSAPAPWELFRGHVRARLAVLQPRLLSPPQTNEVQRTAALLPALHCVAARTQRPLRLLEIGASAGLNLALDRYRLELPGAVLGAAGSPVVLRPRWEGPAPRVCAHLSIASRAGCDLRPTRLGRPDEVRRLQSYVWCDHAARLLRLRAAVQAAAAAVPEIAAAAAEDWLPARLDEPAHGRTTVVFHSSVWSYLARPAQVRIRECLAARGRTATADEPLVWLRLEDPAEGITGEMELRLTLWPDGGEELLAVATSHCDWLRAEPGIAGFTAR